ncbi:MAG TPA: ubiquinol-cytochrome c reductase iron-sulfur subunit [Anaerolineae bacterium]
MSEEKQVNRRAFVVWAVGGLISAALAIPAVAYIIGPALQRSDTQNWIRLGATSKVELGLPTLFKAKVRRQTGWIVNEEEISVYVRTDNGRDFVAMSNVCTHLGCRIRWIAERGEFFCPCHNGVFDKDGKVLSGPPPRPLDRYDVKIENDQLLIQGG